ncbi:MAG: DUF58 domain-containing protein [Pseudomonadales bacterium]|nr:DUF58 domain-containing protein [Pseudomonadales bacterium]
MTDKKTALDAQTIAPHGIDKQALDKQSLDRQSLDRQSLDRQSLDKQAMPTIKQGFWRSKRFNIWLKKRVPPAKVVTLGQRNIFILPTGQGLYFVVLIFFMMLAGINYQNSLIFALAFLLISLFIVSILHTFRNLSGLTIQAGQAGPVFSGQDAAFTVTLSRNGARTYESIVLGWHADMMQGADLLDNTEDQARLYVTTGQRGWFNPGRLLIQTNYPVGLFRAWSWVDLDMSVLVYPGPVAGGDIPVSLVAVNEGEALLKSGTDDFHGLRQHQAGDSLRHIAWKSYARTDELLTKEFNSFVDRTVWLDWDHFTAMDPEARLSRLCFLVVQLSQMTDDYGLRIPGILIQPANNPEHKNKVLKALALFGLDPDE